VPMPRTTPASSTRTAFVAVVDAAIPRTRRTAVSPPRGRSTRSPG
jgi:hypothetical protein